MFSAATDANPIHAAAYETHHAHIHNLLPAHCVIFYQLTQRKQHIWLRALHTAVLRHWCSNASAWPLAVTPARASFNTIFNYTTCCVFYRFSVSRKAVSITSEALLQRSSLKLEGRKQENTRRKNSVNRAREYWADFLRFQSGGRNQKYEFSALVVFLPCETRGIGDPRTTTQAYDCSAAMDYSRSCGCPAQEESEGQKNGDGRGSVPGC